jgi:hypothetical protein
MIKIDFEDTYDPITVEDDFSEMTFESPQVGGKGELLSVQIRPHTDPHLPKVYNLGFGPTNGKGGLQDNIRLKHADSHKVFSTVLFHGFTFLQEYPQLILGIDGSDDVRATMYHLMIKANRNYLEDFFVIIGVDWYVRVFRNWHFELDDHGDLLAKPKPEPFDYQRNRHDLYRYYMFQLR